LAFARKDVLDRHDGDARRSEVLLGAGVDHREFVRGHGAGEDVARHVGDEGNGPDLGPIVPLGAEDRVVARHVHIGGRWIELDLGLLEDGAEDPVLLGGDRIYLPVALGFLDGRLGPVAGDQVIGRPALGEESSSAA
jgi:hypothetical protein